GRPRRTPTGGTPTASTTRGSPSVSDRCETPDPIDVPPGAHNGRMAAVSDRRLEFDNLSKRYGDIVAARDVTFDVRAGEMFGFVGSNGAGKTTAMRIALGVLAADSGEVRFDGVPITMETRRHIGYMPEERGLYPRMKVGEQLVYLARLHGLSATA